LAVHAEPQARPPTSLVTVPFPVPAFVTVRAYETGAKFATAFREVLIVRLHVVDVPVQSPPHPTNICPAPGVAVRVTDVFVP
jgi:hypothetical protein